MCDSEDCKKKIQELKNMIDEIDKDRQGLINKCNEIYGRDRDLRDEIRKSIDNMTKMYKEINELKYKNQVLQKNSDYYELKFMNFEEEKRQKTKTEYNII